MTRAVLKRKLYAIIWQKHLVPVQRKTFEVVNKDMHIATRREESTLSHRRIMTNKYVQHGISHYFVVP